ncbi:hypothetical protein FRX31_006499 [Thalictrum thalictroides]|uniref:Uncharacterized protein n=1 Tax=Thalictrum thalictroides TaxID=46969 RepID=A0A7J6X5R5_THATH|nr:hypothetical protein FRX31_006499 [Thalictrum thalictroides]
MGKKEFRLQSRVIHNYSLSVHHSRLRERIDDDELTIAEGEFRIELYEIHNFEAQVMLGLD